MNETRSAESYYADGNWDCGHAWDANEHVDAWIKLGRPTDPEAAINVVRAAWPDYAREEWIRANASDIAHDAPGVDPAEAATFWERGWQDRALSYVQAYMPEWIEEYADYNS